MKDSCAVHSNTQKAKGYTVYNHLFKIPSIATTIEHQCASSGSSCSQGPEGLILKNCNISFEILEEDRSIVKAESDDDAAWGKRKNVTKLISWLMSDIVGDVSFSTNWNLMQSEKNRHLIDVLPLGACLMNTVSALWSYPG